MYRAAPQRPTPVCMEEVPQRPTPRHLGQTPGGLGSSNPGSQVGNQRDDRGPIRCPASHPRHPPGSVQAGERVLSDTSKQEALPGLSSEAAGLFATGERSQGWRTHSRNPALAFHPTPQKRSPGRTNRGTKLQCSEKTVVTTMNIHWKVWCWSWSSNTLATWCKMLTHQKRPWCWEKLRAGGEGGGRGWDGWMASPTGWTWVWANSGTYWRTGKPGVLQSVGSQRVEHELVADQQHIVKQAVFIVWC